MRRSRPAVPLEGSVALLPSWTLSLDGGLVAREWFWKGVSAGEAQNGYGETSHNGPHVNLELIRTLLVKDLLPEKH